MNIPDSIIFNKDIPSFLKSDLRTGMIVTTRDGNEYVVMLGVNTAWQNEPADIIVHMAPEGMTHPGHPGFMWNELSNYDSFLRHKDDEGLWAQDFDIVKVEQASHPYDCISLSWEKKKRVLLWERAPKKILDNIELKPHGDFNWGVEVYV